MPTITTDTLWENKMTRMGGDIIVQAGATLTIRGSMIYSYGRRFKVYGNLVIDDSTLRMPYIDLAYGFGGDKTGNETNNGNISIVDSYIDVNCFYGFFNRDATVTLRNSIFTGFGRLAGAESEAHNCTFLNTHDRYGSIATYGEVKGINYCAAIGDTSLYYNPDLSRDCVIENMLITGKHLAYLEPTGNYTLTLVDCDVMTRDVIDNGFTGRIEIAHELEVSGELVRDDGHIYTGISRVVTEYYQGGEWHSHTYTMLGNAVAVDGKNKFINPAQAQIDGFVEQSDMVGGNHIVDLVPLDDGLTPSRNCPYCDNRTFYKNAYVINDRWYQNKCKGCDQYALLDTQDNLLYALRLDTDTRAQGKGRGVGLLKGKADE